MQADLRERFPLYELYYETDSHNKVLTDAYNICLAIPSGKKYFIWFTHEPHCPVHACYLVDRNMTNFIHISNVEFPRHIAYSTICYGTLCENGCFVIEDIYAYKCAFIKHIKFSERLTYMIDVIKTVKSPAMPLYLPYMQMCEKTLINTYLHDPLFYDAMTLRNAYTTHHIQFRSTEQQLMYMNHNYKKNLLRERTQKLDGPLLIPRDDINHDACCKLHEAVFMVRPDSSEDIYHLFAYDKGQYTYVDITFIATLQDSKRMNQLFRNIKENTDIELGEESDDEETFQNVSESKYTFMDRQYKMRCIYNRKWRKWQPIDVVPDKEHCVKLWDLLRKNTQTPFAKPFTKPYSKPTHFKAARGFA